VTRIIAKFTEGRSGVQAVLLVRAIRIRPGRDTHPGVDPLGSGS
jgi:hypothetical protein